MVNDDIIDFERINELTIIAKDDTIYNSISGATISRKIIKDMMEIFTENKPYRSPEQLEYIIETLRYNKILISKASLRDKKIESIIDEKENNPK